MMRFSGKIGYAITEETSVGIWKPTIIEHHCYGDVLRTSRKTENPGKVNDNFTIDAQVSIVADPFARIHFMNIAYVEMFGEKWKVTSADPTQLPRIILTLGGLYNEQN